MAIKTQPTRASVSKYLAAIQDPVRQKYCKTIADLMKSVTGEDPILWGPSLVGFGKVQMTYATGKKVDWMVMGFASRKSAISLYLTCDLDQMADILPKLGKYTRGVGCLYIKTLADVHMPTFIKLLKKSAKLAGKK